MFLQRDFFISYASEDRPYATKLYECLCERCKDPDRIFMDKTGIPPGERWLPTLEHALEDSRVVLVLDSGYVPVKHWFREEVLTAIAHAQRDPGSHTVVPVLTPGWPEASFGLRDRENISYDRTGGWPQVAEKAWEILSRLPQIQPWFPEHREIINQEIVVDRLVGLIRQGGVVILVGSHGMGKTTIAREAAYAGELEGALPCGNKLWIDCMPEKDAMRCIEIADGFLADPLRMPTQEATQEEAQTRRALVVFDDADKMLKDPTFKKWLNSYNQAHCLVSVLLTACKAPVGRFAAVEAVPLLSETDAAKLLIQRATEKKPNWQDPDENGYVSALCREVNRQPWMLEQIGELAAMFPLKDLRDGRWLRLLPKGRSDREHPDVHYRFFMRAYAELDDNAQRLLGRLSVFPNGVEGDVIEQIMQPDAWRSSISTMGDLCQCECGRYTVEPQNRKYIADELKEEYRALERQAARGFLHVAIDKAQQTSPFVLDFASRKKALDWFDDNWENLSTCVDIARHGNDSEDAESPEGPKGLLCSLSDHLCDVFFIRGYADKTRSHARKCKDVLDYAWKTRDSAGDEEGMMHTAHNLGLWYDEFGTTPDEEKEAAARYRASAIIAHRHRDNVSEARALYKLGLAESRIARTQPSRGPLIVMPETSDSDDLPPDAEGKFIRSLDLLPETSHKVERGNALAYKGAFYKGIGNWKMAEDALKKSLGIKRDGQDDVGVAIQNLTLADLYLEQGRLPEAQAKAELSVEAFTSLRMRHKFIEANRNLAFALFWQGKWEEAEKRLTTIRDEARALGRPVEEAMAERGLGRICVEDGRWEEAESRYNQSLAVFEGSYSDRKEEKALVLHYLASLYILQGRLLEAEKACGTAMEICQGEELCLAHCRVMWARILCEQEKHGGQERWRKALRECDRGLRYMKAERPFDWARELCEKAYILQRTYHLEEAEKAYKKSLDELSRYHSTEWNEGKAHYGWAEACRDDKKYDDSEYHYRRSLDIFSRCHIAFRQGRTLLGLARLRQAQQDIGQTHELALKAESILETTDDRVARQEAQQLQHV